MSTNTQIKNLENEKSIFPIHGWLGLGLVVGAAPVARVNAGMSTNATDTNGKYVTQVNVVKGTIQVTYGGAEVNAAIAGKVLAIQPYVTPDNSVAWQCGMAGVPGATVPMDAAAPTANATTNVDVRFLPAACRP